MANSTDKELCELYKNDPSHGFQEIVKKFQERVYWQIRRLTKNHLDTEDVMQNVFVKVWNGLPNFREDANLYTWIYRITFNETQNFLIVNNKRKNIDCDPPLIESNASVSGKDYTPEEIETILLKAIETLPDKQAHVFQLKYFDELKFSEISDLLGTSEGALKASYHIAVKKIQSFIEEI